MTAAIIATLIAAPILAGRWLRRRARAARFGQRLTRVVTQQQQRQAPQHGGFDA